MKLCQGRSRHFIFIAAFGSTAVGDTLHWTDDSNVSDEECLTTAFLQDRVELTFRAHEAMQTTVLQSKGHAFSPKPFPQNNDASLEYHSGTLVMNLQPVNLYMSFTLVSIVVGLHELFVAIGSQPLLARTAPADSHMLKFFFACVWFSSFVSASILVPISYDLALSMGQGPMASGLFLSGGILAGGLGILLGGQLAQDKDWDQGFARMICISAPMTLAVVHMVEACVIQSSTLEFRNAAWLYLLLLRQVEAFFASIIIQPLSTMLARAAHPSEQTHRTILSQWARHAGLMAGPLLLLAAQSFLLKGGRREEDTFSPRSNASWVFVILAGQALLLALLASFAVPKALPEQRPSVSQVRSPSAVELGPQDQRRLLLDLIMITAQNAFTVTALEVASIMLLEVAYGWRVEDTSLFLFGVALLGLVFSQLVTFSTTSKVTESFVFLASAVVGVVGCVLTFDLMPLGSLGLFVANGLVCSSGLVASTIADSWASRAAEAESDVNKQRYRLISVACMSVSRFLSAPTARLLLSREGRGWFAGIQVAVAILGVTRVLSACRMIWMKDALKKARSHTEHAPEDDTEGRPTDTETLEGTREESTDRQSEIETDSNT
eukprot:TRINITY_DN58836_c0_g1_i1.p1 TRINITY_DN58836_c0_g1~~TRINITY_DN58836_c0_g1_i1.p1  ORF type:complete len:607 (+),score=79.03 TRINITY_DN58836_c0_g1_i1:158-1978(+)